MADRERQEDIIRVLRLVEYEGPRSLVELQVANSIHGTRYGLVGNSLVTRNEFGATWPRPKVRITAVTLGIYPEVIEEARRIPAPEVVKELQRRIELLERRVK